MRTHKRGDNKDDGERFAENGRRTNVSVADGCHGDEYEVETVPERQLGAVYVVVEWVSIVLQLNTAISPTLQPLEKPSAPISSIQFSYTFTASL